MTWVTAPSYTGQPAARTSHCPFSSWACNLSTAGRNAVFGPRLGLNMTDFLGRLWLQDKGEDIAEYAVMLAVILVIVVGTVRLIGSNANNVFSSVASSVGS